jgi:hypothetical protein
MQRHSLLLYTTIVSSILLPYGLVTYDTVLMITYQYWLFPLWIYIQNSSSYLTTVIPTLSLSFPLLLSVLSLFWCGLNLYTSYSLYQCSVGQMNTKSVWILTLFLLILQTIVTVVVGFLVWGSWLEIVIPLPLHFLIVLFLLWFQVHIVVLEDTALH